MDTPELPAIDSDEIRALCAALRESAAAMSATVAEARAKIGQDGHSELRDAAHASWHAYRHAEQDLLRALTGHASPAGMLSA